MRKNTYPILNTLRKSIKGGVPIVLALFLVIVFAQYSMAQIIRVAKTGSDTPGCGSVGSPCKTLQHAVGMVSVGGNGTILVAGGVYDVTSGREVVFIAGKNITLRGGYTDSFTISDPDTNITIIDGQNARSGITVQSKSNVGISGFTLTNCNAPQSASSLNSFGGGLNSFDSTVMITDTLVVNNRAQGTDSSSGIPGAGAGGGLAFRQSTVTLSEVQLTGNTAQGGDGTGSALRGGLGQGGGLYSLDSTFTSIDGLTVSNNVAQAGDALSGTGVDSGGVQRADGIGGGCNFIRSTLTSIKNLTVNNNVAQGGKATEKGGLGLAGGINIEKGVGTGLLTSAAITDNTAQGGMASITEGGAGLGGGMFITDSNMNIEALTILNNQAIGVSGGSKWGGGGGVECMLPRLLVRFST